MSDPNARKVSTLPFMVSVGLIMPLVMVGSATLLDRLAFGASLWVWGWIVGWPLGVVAGLGALRLWVGKLPTMWSESAR